jgi:hypothetical protein
VKVSEKKQNSGSTRLDLEKLLQEAKNVLDRNWTGNFTIPSLVLYPHQWSWDSAFTAIGNSYFNIERAIKEPEFLFDAQWKNGMLPQIVYANKKNKKEEDDTYFPSAEFYDVTRSLNAPRHVKTSGITQPPIHAISCYYIYKNSDDDEGKERAKRFLGKIFPKLMKFHNYLMTVRDPKNSGLVTLFHPWESGLDNLPIWDEPLSRVKVRDLPRFERLDIKALGKGAEEVREDDETYQRFLYLVKLMKEKYNYDEQKMYDDGNFPFKVKDIVFSSILYVANKYMVKIGGILDEDTSQVKEWISRTEQNFYKYFTPTQKLETIEEDDLYDYDLVKKGGIKKTTIASLVPIYTGIIPKEKIDVLVRWINHAHYCGASNCHVPALPSTDLDEAYFKPSNYWRGPIWINMNWMVFWGLLNMGIQTGLSK